MASRDDGAGERRGLLADVPQLKVALVALALLLAGVGYATYRASAGTSSDAPATADGQPAVVPSQGTGLLTDPAGAVLVGPRSGTQVAGYLAATAGELRAMAAAAPQDSTTALVAFAAYRTPAQAAAALAGATPVVVFFRVPVDGQVTQPTEVAVTALARDVPAAFVASAAALRAAAASSREFAASIIVAGPQDQAEKDSQLAQVALDERQAAALSALCACVYSVAVTASLGRLEQLLGAPGVRLVAPAPAGTPADRLAFRGLRPEDTTIVTGTVPAPSAVPVPVRS